jgi:5'(3')-deoxyribonucleotidase
VSTFIKTVNKSKMKIKEIETRAAAPEVFLDMDGVLADFFAEYAVLAGLPRGSSYRDIPPAKTDPTLNKMVGTDFFYRLPKFDTADQLVDMVVSEFGQYSICSSPLRGDHENSGRQKMRWIKEHLSPQPERVLIESRKEKHAVQADGTPNILIDDRGSNITKWEEAGGIGIKYQADEDGLDVVARGLQRAVEILQGQRKLEPQKLVSLDRSIPVATGSK